jgi:hypothetical protein
LFYEYFNPRSVYFLIGWIRQRQFDANFDINVICSNSSVVREMREVLSQCEIPGNSVTFLESHPRLSPSDRYDYIEYNGGVSLSPSHHTDIQLLSKVLQYLFKNDQQ